MWLYHVQIAELLKRCHLDVDLRDSRQHIKCLRKISRIQNRESVASEKLVVLVSLPLLAKANAPCNAVSLR